MRGSQGAIESLSFPIALVASLTCCLAAPGQERDVKSGQRRQIEAAPSNAAQQALPTVQQGPRLPSPEELEAVRIDAELDRIVAGLTDPLYGNREEATAALLERKDDLVQLYAVLSRGGLTAEQRHRILSVIQERLLNVPRGAVGIKADRRFFPERVVIEELLPNLPARHVLEVGDRVTHLEGKPLLDWDEFQRSVQSKPPGSKIRITVERPREDKAGVEAPPPGPEFDVVEIELQLGSADLLVDPNTGLPQRGGPVDVERQREAQLAMDRWGSRPTVIVVE